ncbi:MAG: PQQ-binding-like beta-propeller repeat protein [Candidatus Acidiferrales bacterium]
MRRKFVRISAVRCCGALVMLVASPPLVAQNMQIGNSRNVAPFTAAQATRGKDLYAKNCASCHGTSLDGSEFASSLRGASFTMNWGGKTAGELFSFINTKMPPASPGSLGPEAAAQLFAFILQTNGVQAGDIEFPTEPAAQGAMTIPRGATQRNAPMMPLSPLAPPMTPVVPPNPLEKISRVTDALLDHPPPDDWLLWRRTYDDFGFSPLKQINRSSVSDLRVAWAWSLPNGQNEATPLEHDGVLFVDSYGDKVQALNAVTGDLLWQYSRQLPSDARLSVKRNLSLYGDRLYVPTSDDYLVALDVRTGDVVWDSMLADYTKGYQTTGGPLVAKGKVMQGVAGQAPGGNFIIALDAYTGKETWRFHSIAQSGEPGDSWNDLPNEKRNGASVWTAGSYDPELNLAFFGVGQTYDTGPVLHRVDKPGVSNDGLFTDCTLAFNPDTGKLVWYFQHVHNDQWDLDWAFEQQLMHLPGEDNGKKMVVTSGKMGIYEGLDAATGKYIFSKDLGIQNVVASIDPKTGEKVINPDVVIGDGKPHTICPHPGGGRNWIAGSYNPDTKTVYVPMVESCMDLIPAPAGQRGNLSSGVNWFIRMRPDNTDGKIGRVEALNLDTKKPVWIDRQRAPQSTCTLDTAGGVVFAGALDRYFTAYDDSTGEILWTIRLNDMPSSCPITFSVEGKQYLAVVVGAGGAQSFTFPVLVPEIHLPPDHGAEIWVFELPEKKPVAKPKN